MATGLPILSLLEMLIAVIPIVLNQDIAWHCLHGYPSLPLLFSDLGRKICTTKGEEQEVDKKELIDSLKLLEGELGDKPFFGGEKLGFVDLAIVSFYTYFLAYETCGNFSIEVECSNFIAWTKRCLEIESVSKSLADPQKVYGFVLHLKKANGIE
ncbi:probable glutathione S-transferase [Eucalyptus grandis]|uniref:probable glutathione S-transferase n=1 Tax=Eucalyptus grandis TaxID=71139 RepID=UPI000524D6AC|nr:probable glutathione S-transferase [Eucalyptus grandis]